MHGLMKRKKKSYKNSMYKWKREKLDEKVLFYQNLLLKKSNQSRESDLVSNFIAIRLGRI